MKSIFGNKSRIVSQLLLVALCILLIVFFMPRENSIEYDYEYNTPWEHEQLIAEFDFAVKKSNEQIEREIDSISSHIKPYFTNNKELGSNMYNELHRALVNISFSYIPVEKNSSLRNYLTCLSNLYRYGIIADADTAIVRGRKNSSINITDGNRTIEQDAAEFVSESEAYSKLLACDSPKVSNYINLRNFIRPNYVYDSLRTSNELRKQRSGIETTLAIVQRGERIINKGDIIDGKLYKTIETYTSEMKKIQEGKKENKEVYIFIGQILFIIMAMSTLVAYIYIYKPNTAHNANKFIFTIISATVFPIIVGMMLSSGNTNVFILPFAIVPMMLCLFVDHSTAFFTNMVSIIICSIMIKSPYEFILLQTLAGNSAILSLKELSSRSQMFKCVFITFLTYATAYLCYQLITEPDLSNLSPKMYINFVISAVLMLFVYPGMFLVEKSFGFISNVTLIELSNLNSNILQRMSQEAPGTFQHSMQVGNLASEAARAIGANSLEVRTGALYHDLGKLDNPIYFTENQNGGINPHDSLEYIESAQIIINHVRDGLDRANKERLPKKIKEFINTHHGKLKAGFFFQKYKEAHPDEVIDERMFTYEGNWPTTREQAILMLADTVEAASHSLKTYTEEKINELVDRLVTAKLNEGALNLSPLTFQEIDTIKTVFKKRLMAIYHTRISYPTDKKEGEEKKN